MLWLKENEPEIYERTACFLISSKDYVIGRLTGEFAGDMTACSTSGAMDLDKKIWSEELIGRRESILRSSQNFFMPMSVSARSRRPGDESGYPAGTKVYAGTGDAGSDDASPQDQQRIRSGTSCKENGQNPPDS